MRKQYWEQWLDTMLERDLLSYGAGRLSSSLRRGELLALTTLEHPDIASSTAQLKIQPNLEK